MPMVTVDGVSRAFADGTTAGAIFDAFYPNRSPRPIAASLYGRVRPLNWAPDTDCGLTLLDYTHDEGRRVYERSLRFLFLLAARDVLPGSRVRIEHSVGYGIYIDMHASLTDAIVARLEERMRALRDADLPLERERWSCEKAVEHFTREGQMDKVRLLSYRPYAHFDMYGCGGLYEYFYGDMLPSTGHVHTFSLLHHAPGIVLQMPSPQAPEVVEPFAERPKLMRAFAESARWYDILGCGNVADLNDMIEAGNLRELVRVSEALQEKSIADIADRIARAGSRAVFVAGPSSSGKTTFTNRLAVQLRVNGLRPVMLSLDNYYRDKREAPLDEEGKPDLERLEALDTDLLGEQLVALFRGETVEIPRFSFHTGGRKPEGQPLHVEADQPILIEGIHGLNPRLAQDVPREYSYRVYISALTTLNLDDHNRIRTTDVRLLRRMVRDYQFRHAPFEDTLAMWPSVRRGEEKFIFPFQEEADIMFNSALPYELSVLKKYAYPMLAQIDESSLYFTKARRLVKFLNYFQTADIENELAPTAILREFIGGCSFYLKPQ
ncbi:MAG: nucleoside kinase [Firmicutes bacterium]|nr:nucleoside kinase [Bacillota bacterium]